MTAIEAERVLELVELETDKVAMEVPAPASGVLREILLQTDAEAVPGAVLGRLATEEEAVAPEEGPAGEVIDLESQAPAPASEQRPSTSLGTSEIFSF